LSRSGTGRGPFHSLLYTVTDLYRPIAGRRGRPPKWGSGHGALSGCGGESRETGAQRGGGSGLILDVIKLGRLRFSAFGALLYLFGALLAAAGGAGLVLDRLACGYAILFTAQLSVSYSNDYFDFGADRYAEPTAFSGGSGVLTRNPRLRGFARAFAVFLMAVSVAIATFSAVGFGFSPLFIAFVVAGNLLGWYYSAPPMRLAYRGLGEAVMPLVIGLMMPGVGYFVTAGRLDGPFAVFAAPAVLYALSFIVNVEMPDLEADITAGKRTLVARRGRRFGFRLNALVLSAASACLLAAAIARAVPNPLDSRILILLSLVPLAAGVPAAVEAPEGRRGATRASGANLAALFVFLLAVDCYLVSLPGAP